MKKGKKVKLSISAKIAAGSLVILLVIGLFWIFSVAFDRKNHLAVLGEPGHVAGSFSFINQDGQRITDKTVQNKVTVVEYFFTSCPSICPLMNSNMKLVYEKFKNTPDFMILSHTVDPERDSTAALKAYAKRFAIDKSTWQFLTGNKDSLYKCATKDYLLSAGDTSNSNFIHTQYVALLDKKRQIRAFYDFTNKENVLKLSSDIRQLLKDDAN